MVSFDRNIDPRLAVIELGSRAIRLLVADVYDRNELRPIDTQVRRTRVMEALRGSEAELASELRSVARNIDDLVQRAARHGAKKVAVFGTEAIRKASETDIFNKSELQARVSHILSGRQEALCSILAGSITMSAINPSLQRLIVIDHGAGSLELACGHVGENIGLEMIESLPLGGTHLLEAFRSCNRDLGRLRDLMRPELNKLSFNDMKDAPVVIMGTVATKCAWLTKRRDRTDRYDPKRVDGVRLPLKGLRQLYEHAESLNNQKNPEKAWDRFQDLINPGEYGGDAAERVATGVIPLIEILSGITVDEFHVSALGTRHGFALLWANDPDLLESL